MAERNDLRSAVEKHAATLVMAVILGVMGWAGWSIRTQSETIIRLDERLANISVHMGDRYTGTQANKDWQAQKERDLGQDERTADHEVRLRSIELGKTGRR